MSNWILATRWHGLGANLLGFQLRLRVEEESGCQEDTLGTRTGWSCLCRGGWKTTFPWPVAAAIDCSYCINDVLLDWECNMEYGEQDKMGNWWLHNASSQRNNANQSVPICMTNMQNANLTKEGLGWKISSIIDFKANENDGYITKIHSWIWRRVKIQGTLS